MAYNRDIRSFAPLPSGALPTAEEIDSLTRRARRAQSEGFISGLRKVFQD